MVLSLNDAHEVRTNKATPTKTDTINAMNISQPDLWFCRDLLAICDLLSGFVVQVGFKLGGEEFADFSIKGNWF